MVMVFQLDEEMLVIQTSRDYPKLWHTNSREVSHDHKAEN